MRVKLLDPPAGFSEDAEYRRVNPSEYFMVGGSIMRKTTEISGSDCLVVKKLEPKKVLKPWYAEIAPVDHWFRIKAQYEGVARCIGFSKHGLMFPNRPHYVQWDTLMEDWEHHKHAFHPDEWEPCGYYTCE